MLWNKKYCEALEIRLIKLISNVCIKIISTKRIYNKSNQRSICCASCFVVFLSSYF